MFNQLDSPIDDIENIEIYNDEISRNDEINSLDCGQNKNDIKTIEMIVETDGCNPNYWIIEDTDEFVNDDESDDSGDYFDNNSGENNFFDNFDNDVDSSSNSDNDSDNDMDEDINSIRDNDRGDDSDNDSNNDNDGNNGNDGSKKFNLQEKLDYLFRSAIDSIPTETDFACVPLFQGSNITVKEFSSKIISHFRNHSVSSALITQIFQIFTDHIPSFTNPHHGKELLQMLKEEKYVHNYPNTIHVITFDVCIKGCMVYTDSTLKKCEHCGKSRFRPCKVCIRYNNQYNSISEDTCQHENRIPFKQLKYRTITLLLVELLKFDSFQKLIKYKWINSSPNETRDVSDRIKYSRNLEEMHETYENHCRSTSSHNVIEVSILLSWFYDGIQLFSKKSSTFQPLLLTILNLPPSIRHVIGVGTFLLSFSMFKGDSCVEKFLLEDCLLEELLMLNKGISFNIAGVEYFLQARMINHIFDLKELCPMLKCQPFQSSKAGCKLCNIGRGTSIFTGGDNKVVNYITKYVDSRNSLPLKHYLRSSGLSRNCCPECDDSLFNEFEKVTIPNTLIQKDDYYKQNEVNPSTLLLCFENKNSVVYKRLNEFLRQFNEDWVWFNHEINLRNKFGDHLYFLSCDYRTKNYTFVNKEEIITIDNERKNNNKKSLHGVKGQSFMFRLPYFRLETDVCIGPSHALKGYLFEVVFKQLWQDGDQLRSNKIRRYYDNIRKETGIKEMFPLILNNDKYPKCSFTEVERKLIQNTLKCILIPKGCSSKLCFAEFRIFDTTSFIGIADIITIMAVYMDVILLCSNHMHDVYKSYYRMLSLIVRKLIAPVQIIANIEPLYWRITEFRALTEGLFPIGCMTYMLHALQCISKHIMSQGPINSFSELRGETNIGKAKRLVKVTGGTKCEDLAYKKFFNKESEKTIEFFGNFNAESNVTLDIDKNTDEITYMFEKCKLKDPRKNQVVFSDFEYDQILHLIMGLIEKKYDGPNECCINSSVYRIINIARNRSRRDHQTCQNYLFKLYDFLSMLENNVIRSILEISNEEAEKFIIDYIRKQNLKNWESISECFNRLKLESNSKNKYFPYILILTNDEKYKKEMERSDLQKYIYFDKYDEQQLFDMNEKSILTSHDFLTLRGIVSLKNKIAISTKATIHGIKHYGRGLDYSEKEYYTNKDNNNNTNNIPTNELNNLSKRWFHPNQFSSWCKLDCDLYAQLNYFFTPSCIVTDKFVSEMKIASVTCRRVEIPKYNNNINEIPAIKCISLKRSKNNYQTSWYKSDVSFIDMEMIFPTRVATIGLHKKLLKTGTTRYIPINREVMSDNTGIIPQGKIIIIDYLALIDVSPENLLEEETELIKTIHNINDDYR